MNAIQFYWSCSILLSIIRIVLWSNYMCFFLNNKWYSIFVLNCFFTNFGIQKGWVVLVEVTAKKLGETHLRLRLEKFLYNMYKNNHSI
jgi:hypothetical protein